MARLRVLVALILMAALMSMGMALDCSRSDDDDDSDSPADDDDNDSDDDSGDDDVTDDDSGDDDSGDDDASDDDSGDDDSGDDDSGDDDSGDDDDDVTPPDPDGYLTGDWDVTGNTTCYIGRVGFPNAISGRLAIEHYLDPEEIYLLDGGDVVGAGSLTSRNHLELDFENPWGFAREVYQDDEYWVMNMGFRRVNDNNFAGTAYYETDYFVPFVDYHCEGLARMVRR